MTEYHHKSGGKPIVVRSYQDAKDQLDAIYASQRLPLPFDGVLLSGYEVLPTEHPPGSGYKRATNL